MVEWERLNKVAFDRMTHTRHPVSRQHRKDLYDFINFLKASMLRVDELRTLRFDACRLERNRDGDERLLIEATGKHGTHTAVADGTAAFIYTQRLQHAQPTDVIFPQ